MKLRMLQSLFVSLPSHGAVEVCGNKVSVMLENQPNVKDLHTMLDYVSFSVIDTTDWIELLMRGGNDL